MNRLEELTEWVRNKPEEAAKRIIELEKLLDGDGCEPMQVTPNQPWMPPVKDSEALPIPDWNRGFSCPVCVYCHTSHPPTISCPPNWMQNVVYSGKNNEAAPFPKGVECPTIRAPASSAL